MSLGAGQSLLHYRLTEKLGEGGMGVVWRAVDTTLDRQVAIKLLPESFADDAERVARFAREAKLLAALNHPNVAAIYSVHEVERRHFIALELVDGEDLAQITARGPLPLDDALRLCVGIAEGLEAAHAAGVIHRDLKPANVKITPDGKVKVLDFGLAKAVASANSVDGHSPTIAPTVTSAGSQAGMILGTAAYMSPEQARGRALDARTDLWSFGCLLYECLTGRVLFAGETVSDSVAAILRKEPDWSLLPERTPQQVRTLLRRCLAREPSRRMHSAGDARIELQEAIEQPQDFLPQSAAVNSPPARRFAFAALLIALGLALGAALVTLWGARETNDVGPSHVAIPLPSSMRLVGYPALTPDGRTVIFGGIDTARGADHQQRLFVRRLDGDELTEVEGSERFDRAALSPDGRWLAFVAPDAKRAGRRHLLRYALGSTAPPQEIADWPDDLDTMTWLNADTILGVHELDQTLISFPVAGGAPGTPLKMTGDPAPADVRLYGTLPDGRHVLTRGASFKSGAYQENVGALDTQSGTITVLVDDGSYPSYDPSGRLIFSRRDRLFAVPFDPTRLAVGGAAQLIVDGLWAEGSYTGGRSAVSASGTLAYYAGEVQGSGRYLSVVDRQGQSSAWSEDRLYFNSVSVSPDGRRLATQIDNTDQGDALLQIRVSEIDRPRLVTVGSRPGMDCFSQVWSTTSRWLAFTCQDQNVARIYVVDPGVPDSMRAISEQPPSAGIVALGFTRDDSHVFAFRAGGDGGRELVTLDMRPGSDLAGGVEVVPMDDGARGGSLSPDGRWLLYGSRATGRLELSLRRIEDDRTVGPRLPLGIESSGAAFWSQAARDGSYQIVVVRDNVLHVAAISTEPTFQISELEALGIDLFDLRAQHIESLDGDRFLAVTAPDSEIGSDDLRLIINWTPR